jgi:hypothetical protein
MFSKASSSSISFAIVTPSFVIFGADGNSNGVRDLIDAPLQGRTGLGVVCQLFRH